MTKIDEIFAALAAECGVRLFTVTVQDTDSGLVRRAWSSHPVDYPVSGTKPLVLDDDWSLQVIVGRKSFVANTTDGFRHLFADHALINRLGCHSVLNIPILRDDGAVAGTINLLDVENFFSPAVVTRIEATVARRHAALLAAMLSVRL